MKILWKNNPHVYSSHLRYGLWKQCEREAACRLYLKEPFFKPDVVVFQKLFDKKAQEEVLRYKRKGFLTVFDINVNYFEMWGPIPWNLSQEQCDDAWEMARLVDVVTTTSEYLTRVISQKIESVFTINESIDLKQWNDQKHHQGPLKVVMLCAIADKIKEILLIKDVLEEWASGSDRQLLLISNQKAELDIKIKQRWEIWDLEKAPQMFKQADLQLAPRDLTLSYNQAHSLTKVGQGMAMGLPAIGSAVPSYLKSPCLIAETNDDWQEALEKMDDPDQRNLCGEKSRDYVSENFEPLKNLKSFLSVLERL